MTERWKPVIGFEHVYEVSDLGNVRSIDRRVPVRRDGKTHLKFYLGVTISQIPHPNDPYMRVWLSKDGVVTPHTVHALVADAFIGPCPANHEVCHRNGIGGDNRAVNLRYGTRSSNREDSRRLGTLAVGERIAQHKLTTTQVRAIRKSVEGSERLAARYGVSLTQVRRIRAGENWRHV